MCDDARRITPLGGGPRAPAAARRARSLTVKASQWMRAEAVDTAGSFIRPQLVKRANMWATVDIYNITHVGSPDLILFQVYMAVAMVKDQTFLIPPPQNIVFIYRCIQSR